MIYEFDPEKHRYTIDGVECPSVTDICNPITAEKYNINPNVLQQAATRGTIIHDLCADYDQGIVPEQLEVGTAMYLMAYIDFLNDYKPKWEYIETPFYSTKFDTEHFFAGTVDRIGYIDDRMAIVDIKTTAQMNRASKISLATQIAGYRILANENGVPYARFDDSFGVQLCKDGTYKVHRVSEIAVYNRFEPLDLFRQLLKFKYLVKEYR